MPKTLHVRNVPDDLHGRLKARSALAGLSMSDYVLREIRQSLTRPTREEVFARLADLPPIDLDPPAAEILRDERRRH